LSRFSTLKHIRRLDPEQHHQRICFLIASYEFPFDLTRALEFALFRTFSVPSISAVLDSTGEFEYRAQRRYDDTDLIISEIVEYGYDSERGKAAIRRMNQLHSRYAISNEDFLYVLSTFVVEPIRWIERFGWRPMCEQEKLAMYYFWREVGRRMNIREIPKSYDEIERYNIEYEHNNFRYTETNRRVGEASRDMFLSWFLPPLLRPLGAPFIYAMMDDTLLTAFGFPHPPVLMRRIVEGALKVRARIVRRLPSRRRPRMRTEMRHRTYPEGYRIEELGPREPAHSSPYLRSRHDKTKRSDLHGLTSTRSATEKVTNGED
jgi:hypothetical protein